MGVSLRLSNNLVLSSVLVICVIIGVKTSKGYIAAGNEACLELVLIIFGPVAPRVNKILPGKSPLFRRFQHQTPFSEGGRGSPVWVKLSSWLNPRVTNKIFVEAMKM